MKTQSSLTGLFITWTWQIVSVPVMPGLFVDLVLTIYSFLLQDMHCFSEENKLSVPHLRLFRIRHVKFLWGISLDSCFWTVCQQSRVISKKLIINVKLKSNSQGFLQDLYIQSLSDTKKKLQSTLISLCRLLFSTVLFEVHILCFWWKWSRLSL